MYCFESALVNDCFYDTQFMHAYAHIKSMTTNLAGVITVDIQGSYGRAIYGPCEAPGVLSSVFYWLSEDGF